uniref:LIM domain 7a n=1 Tax=Poecilia reticulata TaxID=8081 RepID=A0A3P9NJE6_POERE
MMEWREQSSVSSEEAYLEAQRWIEAATKKKFGNGDFRSALENGVLLCDLINKIKPGTIKRVNRLPTPIAGLDNLNVFLKACGKLGLKEAQLFHPGDLQDLSTRVTVKHQETNRRLKNVLITIYWLGRRAQSDRFYDGPYLNFKAFEGLLGTALYKALQESNSQKGSSVRDSGFGDSWYSERVEIYSLRGGGGGGGGGHRRDDSLDSLDSLGSRPHSISSDATLKGSSEGCCSDTEADSIFRMADKNSLSYRRSLVITPKASAQFNQFLPTKDKQSGYVPAPLRKKRAERNEDSRRSWTSSGYGEDEATLTSQEGISTPGYGGSHVTQSALPSSAQPRWEYGSGSGSDSDPDRPDPDLVLDDLASRRFHSPSPAPPTNFAMPVSPSVRGRGGWGKGGPWPKVTVSPTQPCVTCDSRSRKTQSLDRSHVRVDHRRGVCSDSLFRYMCDDSEEDDDDEVGYADPVQDDLYARKIGAKLQRASSVSYNKFLPKFWTPEEDVHVQKIKLGSQRRPWYKEMQGFSRQRSGSSSDDSEGGIGPWFSSAPPSSATSPSRSHKHETPAQTTLVVGKRQQQTQESSDGSKSTSDIQVDPSIIRQNRFEELQKYREQIKDSEDKWQDDLSKWKNRRRSVNSDIVKKKEEREKIEQVTYGSDGRSKSFKEIQDEREPKKKHSIGSRLSSLSYLDDDNDNLFEKPVIRAPTRSLPPRSYTIDVPSYSPEPSKPSLKAEDPPVASPRARRQPSPPTPQETVDGPAARNSITTTTTSNQPPAATSYQKSPAEEHEVLKYTEKTTRDVAPHSSFASTQKELEPRPSLLGAPTGVEAPSSSSLDRQPQSSSMEPKPPAVSRVSASLPRSYQRSDSARLTSVVAPRPFGTQPTRISSLSRAHTTDESHKGVNGNVDVSKKASVPSRYHQYMTSEDEAQSSSAHSSDGEEEEEEEESATAKGLSSTQSIRSLPSHVKSDVSVSPAPGKETSKEDFCEMRISLNQKPNSSRDFGFQAAWDSTGAQVTSIQPGSSAEMCQLQVGDEVLTVNGLQVAQMSYEQWKSSLEEALQKGSLVMDVRRHGQHSPPETKTANSSLDFTSRTVTESVLAKEAPTLVDVASNRVNGDFQDQPVTMRNKGGSGPSVSALVFLCGGSESAMPDIPVPAITPVSSSRWSWNPEEERKRQEKWQKEQELLLQEKYKRDQEKLQEEWLKAQQEIVTSVGHQQVNSHSASPHSPRSSFQQPTLWEEEERQRKVEQERQRQAEERRRREEEERDLQRLQEERKRREMQAEEERMRREMQAEEERMRREMQAEEERKRRAMQAEEEREKREVELRMQRTREEELRKREEEQRRREEERRQQEAVEQQRRQKAFEQQRWAAVSHDFDSAQPPLSFIDRTKSQSSPQLDDDDKPQRRGLLRQPEDLSLRLLEEELTIARRKRHQSQKAASELEWRNSLRYAEAERAMGSSTPDGKSQQSLSQAELERQQILNEMKKKTPLLTDSSWIRQRSVGPAVNRDGDVPPMRRGESLDNLDSSYDSRRSSWTPRSSSFASNYSRPYSGYSGSSSFYTGASGPRRPGSSTLPPSFSSGSLHGGAGTYPAPWSRPSSSHTTPSPITSPEPAPDAYQQRNRSVSGRKTCTFCDTPLGKGAAMIIESLGLCYHLGCFKCIDCKSDLGGTEAGAEVRIRNKQLFCNTCYMRVKTSQPTSM